MRRIQKDELVATNGVEIHEFQFADKELTWLDFGGHEVLHATHQFFLTSQCVYLLVFRLNDEGSVHRVVHWLKTLAQFTCDPKRPAKIIVVGTYADVSPPQVRGVCEKDVTLCLPISSGTGGSLGPAASDAADQWRRGGNDERQLQEWNRL